jgi:hypothetical protein
LRDKKFPEARSKWARVKISRWSAMVTISIVIFNKRCTANFRFRNGPYFMRSSMRKRQINSYQKFKNALSSSSSRPISLLYFVFKAEVMRLGKKSLKANLILRLLRLYSFAPAKRQTPFYIIL